MPPMACNSAPCKSWDARDEMEKQQTHTDTVHPPKGPATAALGEGVRTVCMLFSSIEGHELRGARVL